MSASLLPLSLAELALMTDEEFAGWWRDRVGEPPVIFLKDRAEMARLLVETSVPLRSLPEPKGGSTAVTPSGRQGAV